MWCEFSGILPHSSSDPFGATFPPGEGFGAAVTRIYDRSILTKYSVVPSSNFRSSVTRKPWR